MQGGLKSGRRDLVAATSNRRRPSLFVLIAWAALMAGALYLYFFQRSLVAGRLHSAFSTSVLVGYGLYLVLGSLRGFTLIPSTSLVLAAVAFFPPVPLLILTLLGILISSASIYLFAESLHLDEVFERRHTRHVADVKRVLQRHELPIIIGWSFFPLAPTDVIVYVCGVLRIDLKKCLFGVLIGEGAICAIYIFSGDAILRLWHLGR
jgi:uncharacterized membrane protein YdjX (TVP38/TMEM64 family)